MNKLYLSGLALICAVNATEAQDHTQILKTAKQYSASHAAAHPNSPTVAPSTGAERDAFFSEDFSSGALPAGWTTLDDMTPSGETPVIFQWSDDPAAVTVAAANQPDILTFLAPGASNGYLWANSDRGLASAPAVNHLTRMTTSTIDCSGQPSVLLTMLSTIGVFDNAANEFCKIRVSTDLVSWTDFLPFPCLVTGNVNPPCERFSFNPQLVSVDISSVAANQATVYLQFQWQGGWEYYWAIDDLELSPVPGNELVMDYGYTSQFGGGYEYGRVPQGQMQSTINVGAGIINAGANAQNNVSVHVSITDESGTEVATTDVALGTINPGDTMVADADMTFPSPLDTGLYTADFTMTSDSISLDGNTGDNARTRYFAVTLDVYSVDAIDVVPDSILGTSQIGTASFADNTQDVRFLNYYEVHNPLTATGVTIKLGTSAEAGSYFIAMVYDTADVLQATDLTQPLVASDIHVITDAEIAAGEATAEFFDPYDLDPNAYFVSANLYQEGESDLYILDDGTVPQPAIASMLWIPVDDQNQFLYGGNGTAWAVRLSSSTSIGVQELTNLSGVSIYPSLTNGPVEIRTETPGEMSVAAFNTLGELVQTSRFNGVSSTLDLSGQAPGLYTIRVSDGTLYHVQRIALK